MYILQYNKDVFIYSFIHSYTLVFKYKVYFYICLQLKQLYHNYDTMLPFSNCCFLMT